MRRVIHTGDSVQAPNALAQTDALLADMAALYRDRIRAIYNNDRVALQNIGDQIDRLKEKLAKL
jgi:hypothetical protein